ncbi:MAG: (2Fe-2S)-binding protein [Polyangiaceae bacterium]|nr:(2Fe-2S)-binding protein [Polyangiaceae bacterium]MBK8941139.1 (2Fe-2S)-binding protein [Polyangiaceae bacterium]
MYVCCCMGVTDKTIRLAIEGGAASVEEVVECTRAGSKCGSCRAEIAQMIAEEQRPRAERVPARRLPLAAEPREDDRAA